VSPNGHDLTNNNSVTFSDGGPAGSYADFNGTDQSLTLADHADFTLTTAGSFGAWFNQDAETATAARIISKYDNGTSTDRSYRMYVNTANTALTVQWVHTSTTIVSSGGPAIAFGTWYHAVATYDGANTRLYVNGVEVAEDAMTGTVVDSAEIFAIGAGTSANSPEYFFNGQIGGAFVSATAMTAREVAAEYQRGLRRINSTIDTNDTISDNDIAAIAADPAGKYVTVMGDDKAVQIFDQFGVPVASDTYPGTTAREPAIKSMPGGTDPHYVMAGSDQIEIVQPDTRLT
jgi:hypothetical protein